MSRSYRKHFIFDEEPNHKQKKYANRKVRHNNVGQNGGYKKAFPSWNIHSAWQIRYYSEDDFVKINSGYGDSEKELRKIWRKHFLSK